MEYIYRKALTMIYIFFVLDRERDNLSLLFSLALLHVVTGSGGSVVQGQ